MKQNVAVLTFALLLHKIYASEKYVSSFISVEPCTNPVLPYAKVIPVNVHLEIYNSKGVKYLRGFVEAKSDINNEGNSGYFAYGYETPNGVDWLYELKNLNCESFVLRPLFNALGLPFLKKCMLKKGKYDIVKMDLNKLEHSFQGSMARKYGVYVAVVAFNQNLHTLTCWKARFKVQPDKRKH